MSDQNRKNKMISLRLSEEEYAALRTHSSSYGARNVSDLARLALQRIMTGPAGPEDACAPKLSELDQRVRTLESHVSLLLERERVMS